MLVERFVEAILEDGMDPARILAITFTRRAAGELRGRIRERLVEAGARTAARFSWRGPTSDRPQLLRPDIRAHALEADVDPRFEVIEDALANALREEAWAAALADALEEDQRGSTWSPPSVRRGTQDRGRGLRTAAQRGSSLRAADAAAGPG